MSELWLGSELGLKATVRLCLLSPSQVWRAQRSPKTLQLYRGRGKERPRSGLPHLQKRIVGIVGVAPDCSKRLRRGVLLWGHLHHRERIHSSGQRQNYAGTTQVKKGRGGDIRPQVHPSTPAASCPWPGVWIHPAPTQIGPTPLPTPTSWPSWGGLPSPAQPLTFTKQKRI